MIKTAYLVGAGSPATTVAGLPVLLRQALSLQDAGIVDLVLVDVGDRSVLRDSRLRIPIRDESVADIGASGPALVTAVGCVWPQALGRRLVDLQIGDDDILQAGEDEAAIFVCGAARVKKLVTLVLSLSKDELVVPPSLKLRRTAVAHSAEAGRHAHHERLRDREFVALPRSPQQIDAAVATLLQSLYKPTDGLIARYVDRRVSLAITKRLLSTRVTPNQMTFVATLVGAIGVLVVSRGGYWSVLAGTALFEAQGILDGCDGEIARIKHLPSRAGEWFDQVADDVLNIALLISVGIGLSAESYRYALPLTKVAVVSQIVFVAALYAGLLKNGGGGSVARLRWWIDGPRAPASQGPERSSDRFWRFIVGSFGDLTRRDFISFLYLASAIAGWMHAAFVWQALVTIGSAVATSVQWLVWGGPELQSHNR